MINRQDIEKLENDYLGLHLPLKAGRAGVAPIPEEEHPYRTRFQRDRDRILHTSAFRKLEYKTQVFVYHEGRLLPDSTDSFAGGCADHPFDLQIPAIE